MARVWTPQLTYVNLGHEPGTIRQKAMTDPRSHVRRRLVAAAALVVVPALAQSPQPQRFGPNEGRVLEIDKAAGEITLQHGDLPELSMEPMTMVFVVADPVLLDRVRPGDRVVFKAGLVAGRFAVLSIRAIQPK